MAKFGSKPPGEEVASAVGPRMLRPIPHSSLQAVKTSVASRAAGFESTATPKPSGLKPTLSFSEHSGSAGPKPNPPWVSFPKPGTTARTQTEGLTPQKEAKPSFVKPGVGTKSLVSAFSAQAGEEKPVIPKPLVGLKAVTETRDLQKENESRFTKPPPFAKPLNPGNSYEKPAFPKPSGLKPSLGDRSTFPKPGPKPGAESVAGHKDSVEKAANEDGAVGRFPLRPVKQISGQGLKPTTFLQKPKAEEHSTAPPSIRPKPKGQFLAKRQSMEDSEEGKGLDTPKRKPLPATWTLGPPPQKPSRPPSINLDKFKQQQDRQPAIPPAFNKLANKQPPAPAPAGPSLPPRPQPGKAPDNTLPMDEEDQNYDDVSPAGPLPPPLPPLKLEDRQKRSNSPEENEDSGGEMYEDLDSYRSRKDIKEMEKKREKDDRKRQEQERREQREKEKKEQDIRKRFKVVGTIEVFQMVKASVDYKGGKNDLSFKQGENLEVIRITDNPEGRWLARTMDGCYGYIKVTCVDIDYDDVRKKAIGQPKDTRPQPEADPELYDDVAPVDDITTGPGNTGFFPPPPSLGDEIYDDVDNPPDDTKASSASQETSKAGSWSWSLLKKKKGKEEKDGNRKARDKENSDNKGESESSIQCSAPTDNFADGEDLYDDVGHDEFPPPPPEISGSKNSKPAVRGKKDEKDAKKNKKFEKEEKEFRKKFKYDGEIKVLGMAEVAQTLTSKKWSNKDLPLKAGEVLDIIQYTDNTKLLCRNDDGKFGYVQKVNLTSGNDDGDIYDDIDADCIYDND